MTPKLNTRLWSLGNMLIGGVTGALAGDLVRHFDWTRMVYALLMALGMIAQIKGHYAVVSEVLDTMIEISHKLSACYDTGVQLLERGIASVTPPPPIDGEEWKTR